MPDIFTEEEWEQIAARWSFVRSILPEIDRAIEDHNQGQLWASMKGVSERTADLAEGVVSRILHRAKEQGVLAGEDARIITHALVADEKYQHLYWHSVYFKTAVDAVVRDFLPAVIAGFAAMAEEKDSQLRHALEAQRMTDVSTVAIEDIQRWLNEGRDPPK